MADIRAQIHRGRCITYLVSAVAIVTQHITIKRAVLNHGETVVLRYRGIILCNYVDGHCGHA